MTTTAITTTNGAAIMERVITAGDLSKLQPLERVEYYRATCESLQLNPLTKPFEFITLNSKLVLYATRNCTDQLRARSNVSIQIVSRERLEDIYVVTARATLPDGRADESIGAVTIANLRGEALANALMKAETKAKRRATLSIVGLSFSDETEIETIPGAQRVAFDVQTGAISAPLGAASYSPPNAPQATNDNRATDKQVQMIYGVGKALGYTEGDLDDIARGDVVRADGLSRLTTAQASAMITLLKQWQADDEQRQLAAKPKPAPLSDEWGDIDDTARKDGAVKAIAK